MRCLARKSWHKSPASDDLSYPRRRPPNKAAFAFSGADAFADFVVDSSRAFERPNVPGAGQASFGTATNSLPPKRTNPRKEQQMDSCALGGIRSVSSFFRLLTLEEAAEWLHKSPRWLRDWLRHNSNDSSDRPYCRKAGRTFLFTEKQVQLIFEALPCPSKSARPATRKPKTFISGGHTSASQWTRAAELTNDPSLQQFLSESSAR
jgi:hypothetical protein